MSTKIAINGLGRIGRAILKLVIDEPTMELVAVNDLVDVENLSYLLRFDTVYGRYSKPVVVDGGNLVIAGRKLRTKLAPEVYVTVGGGDRVRDRLSGLAAPAVTRPLRSRVAAYAHRGHRGGGSRAHTACPARVQR